MEKCSLTKPVNQVLLSLFVACFATSSISLAFAEELIPFGDNLLKDGGFEGPLESSPWTAEPGPLADLFYNSRDGQNFLFFSTQTTLDIQTVRQDVQLPCAYSYELSFSLYSANRVDAEKIEVSLGAFDPQSLSIQSHTAGEYIPSQEVRVRFGGSGRYRPQPPGEASLAISIQGPLIGGIDIDNVRLLAHQAEHACGFDSSLIGDWGYEEYCKGLACSTNTWAFTENDRFTALFGYHSSKECSYGTYTDYYHGSWCVDRSYSPKRIYFFIDRIDSVSSGYSPDEGECPFKSEAGNETQPPDDLLPENTDEKDYFSTTESRDVFEENIFWYGLYNVEADVLSLEVEACPVSNFVHPYFFGQGSSKGWYDNMSVPDDYYCRDKNDEVSADNGSKSWSCIGTDALAPALVDDFGIADANADGVLSAFEALGVETQSPEFQALDQNDDNTLSPSELLIGSGYVASRHSADTDLDGEIELGELLRAIQLFNFSTYSCAPFAASEDGYLPQPLGNDGVDPTCPAHASDYNPADGKISLSELLRVIQLFNASNYTACPDTGEDGFCL